MRTSTDFWIRNPLKADPNSVLDMTPKIRLLTLCPIKLGRSPRARDPTASLNPSSGADHAHVKVFILPIPPFAHTCSTEYDSQRDLTYCVWLQCQHPNLPQTWPHHWCKTALHNIRDRPPYILLLQLWLHEARECFLLPPFFPNPAGILFGK